MKPLPQTACNSIRHAQHLDALVLVAANTCPSRHGHTPYACQSCAGQGHVYNQLGALVELWDGSGSGVCPGACMNFALATTAQTPGRSGSRNWLRCIGMHRNALQSFLKDHNLQKVVASTMCVPPIASARWHCTVDASGGQQQPCYDSCMLTRGLHKYDMPPPAGSSQRWSMC